MCLAVAILHAHIVQVHQKTAFATGQLSCIECRLLKTNRVCKPQT